MLHPLGEILCAGATVLQPILLYFTGSFVKLLGILSALRSQMGSHLCQSTPKPQGLLPWENQVESICTKGDQPNIYPSKSIIGK